MNTISSRPQSPDPKAMAKRLRLSLAAAGTNISHSQALEFVAHQWGSRDWNTFAATVEAAPLASAGDPTESIPVLRIFDAPRAFSFYGDYLGFRRDWPENFGDHEPVYAQVSRGRAKLHLSEHHGDASPGAAVLLTTPDVRSLEQELLQHTSSVGPVVEQRPWGLSLTVQDPFNNRLTFQQPQPGGSPMRVDEVASPIRHSFDLACTRALAFDLFTHRMGEWWTSHSAFGDRLAGVEVDPRVGGAVLFVSTSGEKSRWGTVTVWEPDGVYAQTFTLAHDPEYPSEIRATFTPTDSGCRLDFEHGGWTPGNASRRNHFGDWPEILGRFVALANRQR